MSQAQFLNNSVPVISLTQDKTTVVEGELFTRTFKLSSPVPAGGLTLNLPFTFSNDPLPGDTQFLAAQSTGISTFRANIQNNNVLGFEITLAAGVTEATAVFRAADDGIAELDEVEILTLGDGTGYIVNPELSAVALVIEDKSAPVVSTGNQTLFGTNAAEAFDGQDGNDTIYGNGGSDTLIGGSGNDLIYGGSQADTIFGARGDDIIYANGGSDFIDTGSGLDTVWLGAGAATVVLGTGAGYDTINNFQLGATQLQVTSLSNLRFTDSTDGTQIFQGDDLLAIVSWKSASTFSGNVDQIFVV